MPEPASPHCTSSLLRWSPVMQADRFRVYMTTHKFDVWGIILLTSAIALSYNVVHSLMIQRTSAVTTTVLGEVKIVGLMLASFIILGALRCVRSCLLSCVASLVIPRKQSSHSTAR